MDTAVLAVRTILSLAVVLGLIWYAGRRLNDSTSGRDARAGDSMLAGWVRKAGGVVGRWAPARSGRRAGRLAPVVAVVGRQAIGPKASVAVVDVGGQRLVLGVSDAGVTLLTTMDAPAEEVAVVEPVTNSAVVATQSVQAAPGKTPAAALPDFDDALAAATAATAAPQRAGSSAVAGSILAPSTWRQARAALRQGSTP